MATTYACLDMLHVAMCAVIGARLFFVRSISHVPSLLRVDCVVCCLLCPCDCFFSSPSHCFCVLMRTRFVHFPLLTPINTDTSLCSSSARCSAHARTDATLICICRVMPVSSSHVHSASAASTLLHQLTNLHRSICDAHDHSNRQPMHGMLAAAFVTCEDCSILCSTFCYRLPPVVLPLALLTAVVDCVRTNAAGVANVSVPNDDGGPNREPAEVGAGVDVGANDVGAGVAVLKLNEPRVLDVSPVKPAAGLVAGGNVYAELFPVAVVVVPFVTPFVAPVIPIPANDPVPPNNVCCAYPMGISSVCMCIRRNMRVAISSPYTRRYC